MSVSMHDTDHPIEHHLTAYLLGELDADAQREVDAHVATCATCRATLARLDAAFVASVEALDPVVPPSSAWDAIETRTRTPQGDDATIPAAGAGATPPPTSASVPRWAVLGWAATLLAAVTLGAWGFQLRTQLAHAADVRADLETHIALLEATAGTVQARAAGLATEQARLVRWLARDDVATARLPAADDGIARGSVLFLPDQRALVALREPPGDDLDYVVWGRSGDADPVAVRSFKTRTEEVDAGPYDALVVSLESWSEASEPTRVLGEVRVPSD